MQQSIIKKMKKNLIQIQLGQAQLKVRYKKNRAQQMNQIQMRTNKNLIQLHQMSHNPMLTKQMQMEAVDLAAMPIPVTAEVEMNQLEALKILAVLKMGMKVGDDGKIYVH